jgi:multidrug resistance efflux pump
MMNDRQRLRRLNEALDASENEVAQIESEIAAHDDQDTDIDELKRRRNLAQAKANALQAVFDADFFLPRKSSEA